MEAAISAPGTQRGAVSTEECLHTLWQSSHMDHMRGQKIYMDMKVGELVKVIITKHIRNYNDKGMNTYCGHACHWNISIQGVFINFFFTCSFSGYKNKKNKKLCWSIKIWMVLLWAFGVLSKDTSNHWVCSSSTSALPTDPLAINWCMHDHSPQKDHRTQLKSTSLRVRNILAIWT